MKKSYLKETKHGTISCGDEAVLWEGETAAECRLKTAKAKKVEKL